jgi:hypothetical protein
VTLFVTSAMWESNRIQGGGGRRDDEDRAGGGAGLGAGRVGPTTTPAVPPLGSRLGFEGGWRILIDNRRGAWEQWED